MEDYTIHELTTRTHLRKYFYQSSAGISLWADGAWRKPPLPRDYYLANLDRVVEWTARLPLQWEIAPHKEEGDRESESTKDERQVRLLSYLSPFPDNRGIYSAVWSCYCGGVSIYSGSKESTPSIYYKGKSGPCKKCDSEDSPYTFVHNNGREKNAAYF